MVPPVPNAKAGVRGVAGSGPARASKSSSDSHSLGNRGDSGSSDVLDTRRAAKKKKPRPASQQAAHVLVSSSYFFLGATLLPPSFCILWKPHCVHSVPLCEFRRGARKQGDVPLGHLLLFVAFTLLQTSMTGYAPVREIFRCYCESTPVSRVFNLIPHWNQVWRRHQQRLFPRFFE